MIAKCVSVEKCEMSCLKKPISLEKLLVFKKGKLQVTSIHSFFLHAALDLY